KPIDTRMYGPSYMPWGEALNYVIGGPAEYVRDVMLMIIVPLLIVRGRSGLFLFFYLCAVWLLCLNPLLASWWMRNILAYCYFRLVYLLQLPLLCALLAAASSSLWHLTSLLHARLPAAFAPSGVLRRQAQAFVEGDHSQNPKRVAMLELKFRQVIETGRANAVAVPESESQSVLATLKSINPDWHRVLEAGGLVLMLPGNTEPRG